MVGHGHAHEGQTGKRGSCGLTAPRLQEKRLGDKPLVQGALKGRSVFCFFPPDSVAPGSLRGDEICHKQQRVWLRPQPQEAAAGG